MKTLNKKDKQKKYKLTYKISDFLYGDSAMEYVYIFTGYKFDWSFPFIHKTYTRKNTWEVQKALNSKMNEYLDNVALNKFGGWKKITK